MKQANLVLWGMGALTAITVLRELNSRAKEIAPPAAAPKPGAANPAPKAPPAEEALQLVKDELDFALKSTAWSAPSKTTLQAVKEVLGAKPASFMETISQFAKPQAAYDSLAALPDTERQTYTKQVYYRHNQNTFSVDKRAAAIAAWAYLHLGGKSAEAIRRGQTLGGMKGTGVLDKETLAKVKELSGRPFWAPVLVAWGLTDAVQGLMPMVSQRHRIQFLKDNWDDLLDYAPSLDDAEQEEEEAFASALDVYQDDMLDPERRVDPGVAALNAYRRVYQFEGAPHDIDIDMKNFFLGVLGRIDDMILYQAMKSRGYNDARIDRTWGPRGAPPGTEEGGFLA